MRVQVASEPGSSTSPSEDFVVVGPDIVAVLDGATVRTDTGCIHGVPWYVERLGNAILQHAHRPLEQALSAAIEQTAASHRQTCDLDHPGTPSAAVAILAAHDELVEYLVLGDVTVVLDDGHDLLVVTDDRVDRTAVAERAEADRLRIGSPEKAAALVRMKHAELSVRNKPGGYWIASTDPTAVQHALRGQMRASRLRRAVLLTDGATRAVTFQILDWSALMQQLATHGPRAIVTAVRAAEATDLDAAQWIRNKPSDDATVAYCDQF